MRKCIVPLMMLAFLLVAGAAQAEVPGNNPLITVNEFGSGTILFPGGVAAPMPGIMQLDPGPGGLPLALTYSLLGPPSLVAGDLVLIEPGTQTYSDIIRFNPAATGNPNYVASLVFYSDLDVTGLPDGLAGLADGLADTGFPLSFYANVLPVTEVGPEGSNGFVYTPLPGQPGYVDTYGVTYSITSDVPEPASASLVVIAGGLLFAGRRWVKARATQP